MSPSSATSHQIKAWRLTPLESARQSRPSSPVKALDIDPHNERQKVGKVIDVFLRLARLHPV